MDQSIPTRESTSKKELVTKEPKFDNEALHLGGALEQRLDHDKPHLSKQVTGSVVAFQLFL